MTSLDVAISVLHVGVNAMILWVSWHWLWRRSCQERLRQDLFDVRDELFDYARSGKIDFSDDAYVMLRSSINSMIRFSHLISATRLFVFICCKRFVGDAPQKHAQKKLKAAFAEVDPGTRLVLEGVHAKMYKRVAAHVIRVSPHIIPLSPFFVLLDGALSVAPKEPKCANPTIDKAALALIESQAIEAFRAEAYKRRATPELISAAS